MEANVVLEEEKMKKPSLLGIITSPSNQFERMKEKAPIGLPIVIILLLMAVSGALVAYLSLNNPVVKNNANIPDGFNIPIGFTMGMGAVGGLLGGAIMFFVSAAFYKLCMIFMGNDTPYKKLLVVVIYSSFISSIGALINALLALIFGGYEPVYTSLAPIAGDNKILHSIASNFDIFNIWYYVILALGLQIVAGLSKNKATALVIIVFLIGIGISSVGGLFQTP